MSIICEHCYTVNEDGEKICKSCNKALRENKPASFDLNEFMQFAGVGGDPAPSLEGEVSKINADMERTISEIMRGSGLQFPGLVRADAPAARPPSAAGGAPLSVVRSGTDLYGKIDLRGMDDIFARDFRLKNYKWFSPEKLFLPTLYCATPEEFISAMCERMDVSETVRRQIVKGASDKMRGNKEKGGTFGVFIHSRGCYLNGWLAARVCGEKAADAETALKNPAVKAFIIRVAAHERLGHGFLSEFTKQGEEARTVNLWLHRLAHSFNLKLAESPDYTLWDEKWRTIFSVARYMEEGWATWIENYITPRMQLEDAAAPDLNMVLNMFGALTESKDLDDETKDFLKAAGSAVYAVCSGAPDIDGDDVIKAMRFLQKYDDNLAPFFSGKGTFGQPPCYVLGQVLIQALERKFGAECLPLLLAIAGNVAYGMEKISNADLELAISRNPMLNIDVRLALLTRATAKKGDLAGLAMSAREDLSLSVPEGVIA